MPRYWIDVEDADGKRFGAGPIITATGWECSRLQDRVGAFSFTMPATDPKRTLLQVKRYVRCWGIRDSQLACLGAGVIEQVIIADPTNPVLQVSGRDLLRELSYRNVGNMWLADEVIEHAHRVAHVVVGPDQNTDMPLCTDFAVGDTSTYEVFTHVAYHSGEFLYIGHMRQFDTIHFVMQSGCIGSSDWRVQVFDTQDFGWKDVTVVENTTITLGSWLRQSGFIRFEIPDNWGLEGLTQGPLYDVRIYAADNTMYDMGIYDVAVGFTRPTTRALEMIAAKFPPNWALDDVNGYTSTQPPQATGAELLTGGAFETFTGTADDSTTDTFPGWTNAGTDANKRVEAWTGTNGTPYNVRLVTNASGAPYLYQAVTVAQLTDYVLSFQCQGDGGSGQILYRLKDLVTGRYLTYHLYTLQTAATWVEHMFRFTTPPNCISLQVEFYCTVGAARLDTVSLLAYTGGEVYLELAGESILEALNRLAEQTGEHFILSYGGTRRVLWLGFDERRAGVRAINGGNALTQQTNPAVAQISNLTEQQDAYDLVSRVYVYGGDTGDNRLSLAGATRSVPTGYTLNTADNYIERDSVPYPRIDKTLEFTDVTAADTTTNAQTFSANMLVERAQTWLETHSASNTDRLTGDGPRAYALELVGCQRTLYPCHMLPVNYITSRDGVTLLRLITNLWIISVTETIDADGIPRTMLEVATVDALARTDAEALVNEARINRALRRRTEQPRRQSAGQIIVTRPTPGEIIHTDYMRRWRVWMGA